MIQYTCPNCGNQLNIPDEYAGKQGKCNKCENAITVPGGNFSPDVFGEIDVDKPPPKHVFIEADEPVATSGGKDISQAQRVGGCLIGCVGLFIFSCAGMFGLGSFLGTGVDGDAINAVKATVERQRDTMGTFQTAPMRGGTAVLSSRDWAYWVDARGVVYHANGFAKSASPNTSMAPVGIGFSEIKAAIDGNSQPTSTRTQSTTTPAELEWYQGGTLHSATVMEWFVATPHNRIATAADWLTRTAWKGHLNRPSDFEQLHEQAIVLVGGVDELAGNESPSTTVDGIAATLLGVVEEFGPAQPKPQPQSQSMRRTQPTRATASMVYTTTSGSKYHLSGCRTIKNSPNLYESTITVAIRDGYDVCKVCNPPSR